MGERADASKRAMRQTLHPVAAAFSLHFDARPKLRDLNQAPWSVATGLTLNPELFVAVSVQFCRVCDDSPTVGETKKTLNPKKTDLGGALAGVGFGDADASAQ